MDSALGFLSTELLVCGKGMYECSMSLVLPVLKGEYRGCTSVC